MGNCFSDPSTAHKPGKGQVLGSGPPPSASAPSAPAVSGGRVTSSNSNSNSGPPRTLGGAGGAGEGGDPRERALRAAEERAKAAQGKGVNASNPKAGQLSAKLAAEKRKPSSPSQTDDRLMDRGQWN